MPRFVFPTLAILTALALAVTQPVYEAEGIVEAHEVDRFVCPTGSLFFIDPGLQLGT